MYIYLILKLSELIFFQMHSIIQNTEMMYVKVSHSNFEGYKNEKNKGIKISVFSF